MRPRVSRVTVGVGKGAGAITTRTGAFRQSCSATPLERRYGGGSYAAAGASQDIAPAARERLKDGGTLRWAVDTMPGTLNAFQADADATTTRITGAVLPTLFTLDERGRPQRNADYLDAADITARDPKQVVTYKI